MKLRLHRSGFLHPGTPAMQHQDDSWHCESEAGVNDLARPSLISFVVADEPIIEIDRAR